MKHAFMVICHNNIEVLKAQMSILDSDTSDFYIHIDKGAQLDPQEIEKSVSKSHVYFLESKKIKWGHFSQVECELRLLSAAVQGEYDYYHLLSGVDMPIKTYEAIDEFFEANAGNEFIHFDTLAPSTLFRDRIDTYNLFPGRSNFIRKCNGIFVRIQKSLNIHRLKNKEYVVQKGCNWFSITHKLAMNIVNHIDDLRRQYHYSFCGDEVFLQTFVFNSSHRDNLYNKNFNDDYHSCMRMIDWERGNPYIYRIEDLELLLQSDFLFARKFDYATDGEIVKKLVDRLVSE